MTAPPPESKRRSLFAALSAKFTRSAASRQIFLCGGPDCCRAEVAAEAMKLLRARIDAEGLSDGEGRVACTKTGCLGVCGEGPIAVVYPGETWYSGAQGENLERIVTGHLRDGEVVRELTFEPPPDARPPGA